MQSTHWLVEMHNSCMQIPILCFSIAKKGAEFDLIRRELGKNGTKMLQKTVQQKR